MCGVLTTEADGMDGQLEIFIDTGPTRAQMIWKQLSFSICVATVVASVSYVLLNQGGEFVLWPGFFVQVMFNGLLLAIPSGDDFYKLPSGAYLIFSIILHFDYSRCYSFDWSCQR